MLLALMPIGCGNFTNTITAPLFTLPLTVEGQDVGSAILDTGGGYEVMLADDFGLSITKTTEVLVFGGRERIGLTEPFSLTLGGLSAQADTALVGLSLCDCNGIGYFFFRKTGVVLGLDFQTRTAELTRTVPLGGVTLPFANIPRELPGFDSTFLELNITIDGQSIPVVGLLDTGSNATIIQEKIIGRRAILKSERIIMTIAHDDLGEVALPVYMFNTPGLPDLIVGTDLMGAWSDRWYFQYDRIGGSITAFPKQDGTPTINLSQSLNLSTSSLLLPIRTEPIDTKPQTFSR